MENVELLKKQKEDYLNQFKNLDNKIKAKEIDARLYRDLQIHFSEKIRILMQQIMLHNMYIQKPTMENKNKIIKHAALHLHNDIEKLFNDSEKQ